MCSNYIIYTSSRVHVRVGVCVCNPWIHREPFGLEQGRVALSPYLTQRSCGREWSAGPDQPCVPAPLFRKTGGNGTRHTCVCRCLSFCIPLVYSIGLAPNLVTWTFNPNFLASTH